MYKPSDSSPDLISSDFTRYFKLFFTGTAELSPPFMWFSAFSICNQLASDLYPKIIPELPLQRLSEWQCDTVLLKRAKKKRRPRCAEGKWFTSRSYVLLHPLFLYGDALSSHGKITQALKIIIIGLVQKICPIVFSFWECATFPCFRCCGNLWRNAR